MLFECLVEYLFMKYDCHIFSIFSICFFEIPSISNEKPSISIEILGILIENLDFDRNSRYFEPEILKDQVFHTLNLKYQVFRAKYQVFQIQGVKNLVFQDFLFEIPSISIEILGFPSKYFVFRLNILGFSFEIPGISKKYNCIPYLLKGLEINLKDRIVTG